MNARGFNFFTTMEKKKGKVFTTRDLGLERLGDLITDDEKKLVIAFFTGLFLARRANERLAIGMGGQDTLGLVAQLYREMSGDEAPKAEGMPC